jgi:hypothetical protein
MTKRLVKKADAAETASKPSVSVRTLCNEFSAGWCMVEVVMRSLDGQEIGHPEGEVLKRALKILWPINEYLSGLEIALPDEADDD